VQPSPEHYIWGSVVSNNPKNVGKDWSSDSVGIETKKPRVVLNVCILLINLFDKYMLHCIYIIKCTSTHTEQLTTYEISFKKSWVFFLNVNDDLLTINCFSQNSIKRIETAWVNDTTF
jgi:hypothetical protein